MMRFLILLVAGGLLICVPACSGGGVDSRNKDLDRPKPADEKPAELPKKNVQPPVNEKPPELPKKIDPAPAKDGK